MKPNPDRSHRSRIFLVQAIAAAITMTFFWTAANRSHGQTPVTSGIDTYVTSAAKAGPDGSYGEETGFEWDGSDGGGSNQSLLWFDISPNLLDAFLAGSNPQAILKLRNIDSGDSGNLHRMTVNWLEGPEGGNFVTFNSIPDGPGIEAGVNAEEVPNASTGPMSSGMDYEIDVTTDVLAWASGEPNYGWGIVPTGGGGNGIASFENPDQPSPRLELSGLFLTDGDFNRDGVMDTADFGILATNFLTGTTFEQGDMNIDGIVNLQDFVDFRRVFSSMEGGVAAVPEPHGLVLVVLAGVVFAMQSRRTRK